MSDSEETAMREQFIYAADLTVDDYEDIEMREYTEARLSNLLKQAGVSGDNIEPTVWEKRLVEVDGENITYMTGRRTGWKALQGH